MRSCLVVCATKNEAACGVAAQIANSLRARGVAVDLECGGDVSSVDAYDAVVIGAPLWHGRWQRPARRFLKRHQQMLESKDIAIFALGPCDDGNEGYDRSWNRVIKMLTRLSWLDPVRIEVFPPTELPEESACCGKDEQPAVAGWCRNLAVSMHLTDDDVPHHGGFV